MAEDYEIRFICTDKGTHPSRELLIIGRLVDGGKEHRAYLDRIARGRKPPYEWGAHPLYAPSHREGKRRGEDDWAVWNGGSQNDGSNPDVWRMRCPTCRRDVQPKTATLVPIMDTLHEARMSSGDISILPVKW